MAKTLKVATKINGTDWRVGQTLSKEPEIAAYLRDFLNATKPDGEADTTLSSPEIFRVFQAFDDEGLSPEQIELDLADELVGLESDADDDTSPALDPAVATARQLRAHEFGDKLGETFNQHVAEIIAAGDLVKKGPIWIMDDIIAALTPESVRDEMPWPRSKAPKGYTGNEVFDHYRTTISGEPVVSSFYRDMVLATPKCSEMSERIDALRTEYDKAKDGYIKNAEKTEANRVNRAVKLLCDGMMADRILRRCKTALPKLEFEVQREDDGTPASTLYPIVVKQTGKSGSMKSLTLGQFLALGDYNKLDDKGLTGIDRAAANGGTIDALVNHGLPKKKARGTKAAVSITKVDDLRNVFLALDRYIDAGGDAAITKALNNPKDEGFLLSFGDIMTKLVPIWTSGDVAERCSKAWNAQRKAATPNNNNNNNARKTA